MDPKFLDQELFFTSFYPFLGLKILFWLNHNMNSTTKLILMGFDTIKINLVRCIGNSKAKEYTFTLQLTHPHHSFV